MAAFPANVPPKRLFHQMPFRRFHFDSECDIEIFSFYSVLFNYKCNAYSTWGSDYDFS